MDSNVDSVFQNYPLKARQKLLKIRGHILSTAAEFELGDIEETLKWGEPSYVTHSPKTGTTIRLSQLKSSEKEYGLFVHCQTTLIEEFRVAYPDLRYDKNRGLLFDSQQPIQSKVIKQFIYLALTHHIRKK